MMKLKRRMNMLDELIRSIIEDIDDIDLFIECLEEILKQEGR